MSNGETLSQLRTLFTTATEAIPFNFPAVGKIQVVNIDGHSALEVEEAIEHGVLYRTTILENVSALFIPTNPDSPSFENDTWLFGDDVTLANILTARSSQTTTPEGENRVFGIAYVGKKKAIQLRLDINMVIGLTLGESEDRIGGIVKALNDKGNCC